VSQVTVPNTGQALTKRRFGQQFQRLAGQLAKHVLLIAVSIVFLVPFYWMLTSALKDNSQIFAFEPQWWPNPVHWENFATAIDFPGFPYLRLLGNSVFYAGAVTIGTVFSCAAVAYGFARLRFPGRDLLFGITLATLMIPPIVTFIPTYILFATPSTSSCSANSSRASRQTSPTPPGSTVLVSFGSSGRSCCRWCGRP
jgi:multiple sugar transport system permease protein